MRNIHKKLRILFFVIILNFNNTYAEKDHESVILVTQNNTDEYSLWDNKKLQDKIKENEKKENDELRKKLKSKNIITKERRTNGAHNIYRKKQNKHRSINTILNKTNSTLHRGKVNNRRKSPRIIKCQDNQTLINILNENTGNDEFSEWNKNNPLELRIINRNNRVPRHIKPVLCEVQGKQVNIILSKDLNNMLAAASKRGLKLVIVSCYRSYQHQNNILHTFARNIKRRNRRMTYNQALARANRRAALPGASEHNLGIAIDFGNNTKQKFINTKEYQWMKNNAYKFGFIERYKLKWSHKTHTIYEPWHFRYVGRANAEEIEKSGLCLEDFIRQKMGKNIYYDDNNKIKTLEDSLNDLFETLNDNNTIEEKENSNNKNNEDIEFDTNIEKYLNQTA